MLPTRDIVLDIISPSDSKYIIDLHSNQALKVRISKLYFFIHMDDLDIGYDPSIFTYKVKSLNHYIYFYDDSCTNRYRIYFNKYIRDNYGAYVAEQYATSSEELKIMKSEFFKNGDLLYGKELKYTDYRENNSDPNGPGEKNYYRKEVGNLDWEFWIKTRESFTKAPSARLDSEKKQIHIYETTAPFTMSIFNGHDEYFQSEVVPQGELEYPYFLSQAETPFVCYARTSGASSSLSLFYRCRVNNVDYFISTQDKDKAKRDKIKWTDFFNIQDSDTDHDLVCDLQSEIIDKIDSSDEGRQIAIDELESVFHNQNIKSNRDLVREFRKMACSFPFEWDKEKYTVNALKELADEYHFDILDEEAEHLEAVMSEMDMWDTVKEIEGIVEAARLIHLHPVYFHDLLSGLGMLDMNPYFGEHEKFTCVDTPGFAPLAPKGVKTPYELNGQYFAETTGVFNENYVRANDFRTRQQWNYYFHAGVDFSGYQQIGLPIISFIFGTVYQMDNAQNNSMGNYLVVQDAQEPRRFFVLVHCDRVLVEKDIQVYPGMKVATVGQDRDKQAGPHLHLSVVLCPSDRKRDIEDNIVRPNHSFTMWADNVKKGDKPVFNPFNYKTEIDNWWGRGEPKFRNPDA
ncbi:MAG: M23 family metallopeptidase [Spirochaetales bacterium]|nr:M23 family metallopeptidase [Spirochaetales bacterium]